MTDLPQTPPVLGFADLGLDPRLLAVLADLGYEEPTPIQREAIPVLVTGRDLVGQAATGTGKTAAFALPILGALRADGANIEGPGPHALVLVPTRELAVQVAEALHRYGKALGVSVLPVYGGQAISQQLRALHRGVDIVVATPGRAVDHLKRGSLVLEGVRTVVLDEADEMLDMGFAEDLEAILSTTPATRQTVLFSATLAPRVAALAKRHLREPVTIDVQREAAVAGEMPRVPQVGYLVQRAHKLNALGRILDMEPPGSAIVFCRTRTEVDTLTEALNARGYRAEALHGGLSQEQRDRVMRRFRDETTDLLVATDVAARGLDIEHVSHVINYDVPVSPEVYLHRIGRTGRAGRAGMAITLAEPRERRLLRNIEHFTGQRIEPATVPTVADLRARQMQQTRAAVEEALEEGDFDAFRVIVDALSDGYDVMDIAAAAVKLAHAAQAGAGDAEEIPAAMMREPYAPPSGRGPGRPRGDDRPARGGGFGGGTGGSFSSGGSAGGRGRRGTTPWQVARIFIGAGRTAGVRPADLVGAIANEAGVSPRLIGAIEIADRFAIVEVPDEIAASVVTALSAATIRGRRVEVRLEG
ncbi:MAG: DEAD/DEAH box helicase [Ardenticatenales bacterium]|nr:DEAD/DEAH box helicase [Ardenticatenales bacterium]